MLELIAKGSSSRSSSSRSSSSSKSSSKSKSPSKPSTSKPSTTKSTPTKTTTTTKTTMPVKSVAPEKPKTSSKSGTSKAAPGSKIKTADGKTIQSSTAKPTNIKNSRSTGIVGDNGYTPRFTNGYIAPAGSVVYYPQHSVLDYLPWIFLFSQSHSPRNDQATVVQPDNKQVVVPPEKGGIDGLLIFNWILLILLLAAVCGGIIWLVNKLTSQKMRTA